MRNKTKDETTFFFEPFHVCIVVMTKDFHLVQVVF